VKIEKETNARSQDRFPSKEKLEKKQWQKR